MFDAKAFTVRLNNRPVSRCATSGFSSRCATGCPDERPKNESVVTVAHDCWSRTACCRPSVDMMMSVSARCVEETPRKMHVTCHIYVISGIVMLLVIAIV